MKHRRHQTNGNTPAHKAHKRSESFRQMYLNLVGYVKIRYPRECMYCKRVLEYEPGAMGRNASWPKRKVVLGRKDRVVRVHLGGAIGGVGGHFCNNKAECRRHQRRLKPESDVELYPKGYYPDDDT